MPLGGMNLLDIISFIDYDFMRENQLLNCKLNGAGAR